MEFQSFVLDKRFDSLHKVKCSLIKSSDKGSLNKLYRTRKGKTLKP